MSTSALPATASTPASRRVAAHWEEFLVGVGLLLASAAILPMVLAPSATAESEAEVYDPFSQPAWLLVGVLFLVAAARVLPQMTRAAMRNLPIVAFCYLALVSTLWSDDPASTLERAIDLCFGAAFGLYIGVRFGIEGLVRILGWLTLGILVLSVVFAVALPTYGLDAFHEESWRGVFGTKNELGRMMLVGAVVWAIRGFAREISASRAVVIVSAFAVVGFLSQARTALGVGLLMLGVMVFVWLLSRQGPEWVPIKGLVVTGIVVFALACLLNLDLLLAAVGADHDLTGRTGIWEGVFAAISDHPWLGYGYDTFWDGLEGPSREVIRIAQTYTPHSHNGFLDLVLGLGLVGLVVYVFVMGTVMSRAIANVHHATGVARTFPIAFCWLLILYNLTESGLLTGRSWQWIAFVAVAGALAVPKSSALPQSASTPLRAPQPVSDRLFGD